MTILPITLLFHEGPIARAYLSRLLQDGYKIDEIIRVVYTKRPATKRKAGLWLPIKLKIKYLAKLQELAFNYWPRKIRESYPEVFQTIFDNLSKNYPSARTTIQDLIHPQQLSLYSEALNAVLVDDINDQSLVKTLEKARNNIILFTGGGILKNNMLKINGKKFLHIHPGYLPCIRGADGLLWSTLIRKRPGASAFFMESKIDTGNIIARREYESIIFEVSRNTRPDNKTLYRTIFSYYDPLIRAELLSEIFQKYKINSLPETVQNKDEGQTFSFMDEITLEKTLQILFPNR